MRFGLTLSFTGEAAVLNTDCLTFDTLDEATAHLHRAVCMDGFSDGRLVRIDGLPAPAREDWEARAARSAKLATEVCAGRASLKRPETQSRTGNGSR